MYLTTLKLTTKPIRCYYPHPLLLATTAHTHCHRHHCPQPQPPTTKITNKNKPKIKSQTQTQNQTIKLIPTHHQTPPVHHKNPSNKYPPPPIHHKTIPIQNHKPYLSTTGPSTDKQATLQTKSCYGLVTCRDRRQAVISDEQRSGFGRRDNVGPL